MPIIIPKNIPAFSTLQKENIFVITKERAATQDIRPIEITILNLMPTKIETETQLLRLLSNTPLYINVTFVRTSTYKSTNISQEHLNKFYVGFADIKNRKLDGLIITGAPVETMPFEQVKYWDELKSIMDYAKANVTSTLFICWGAQAGLFHHFGINKILLKEKLSGVFKHRAATVGEPLLKGLDDTFYIPHSRYTALDEQAIRTCSEIEVIASGAKTKSSILKSKDNKMFFFTGHSEYDNDTLDKEYKRDSAKDFNIKKPSNYYDTNGKPYSRWKSSANLIFANWLNYYVLSSHQFVLIKNFKTLDY